MVISKITTDQVIVTDISFTVVSKDEIVNNHGYFLDPIEGVMLYR